MKAGDIVRSVPHGIMVNSRRVGIVVDIIQKKCWRTNVQGKKIDWNAIDSEPHAVVLFPESTGAISIPVIDLEVLDESR